MTICQFCGEEITFRYIDGKVRPIHAYGSPCGERPPFSDDSLKRAVHSRCPECKEMVWLVRHNGGSVWLDELGWPWPKHGCFDEDHQQGFAATGNEGPRPEPLETSKLGKDVRKSLQGSPPVLDRQGRRRCDYCNAMVRPENYQRHCRKEHRDRTTSAGC